LMQQLLPDSVPPFAAKRVRRNTVLVFAVALLAAAVALSGAQFHGLDVQIGSPVYAAPADLQAALRADSVAVARVYDANTADAPHVYPVLWQARHGKSYRTDIFDSGRDAAVSGLRSSALRPGVIALQPGTPPTRNLPGVSCGLTGAICRRHLCRALLSHLHLDLQACAQSSWPVRPRCHRDSCVPSGCWGRHHISWQRTGPGPFENAFVGLGSLTG